MYATKDPRKLHLRVAEESTEQTLWEHLAWFARSFPTDEDCLEALLIAAKINTTDCHHCHSGRIEREHGSRTGVCISCNRATYVTAGTFFDHMRRPRTWWCVIVTLASKLKFSAKSLWDFLGGSYFTIWRVIQNVAKAIETQMTELTLAIASGEFLPAICRRSKETPKGTHPRAEEQEARDGQPREGTFFDNGSQARRSQQEEEEEEEEVDDEAHKEALPSTAMDAPELSSDLESAVAASLSNASPTNFETLSVLTMIDAPMLSATLTLMQLAGTVVRVGGDHFMLRRGSAAGGANAVVRSCCQSHRDEAKSIIEKMIGHLKTVHRGISRKYLQRYACLYWCLYSQTWTLENILSACMEVGELEDLQITEYVSPLAINVLECSSAAS